MPPVKRNHESTEERSHERQTEKRLIESALTVFSEKGYEGASVREIIERAGVTRPVLYYYFKSKEDLFCQLVIRSYGETFDEIEAALKSARSCRERLRAFIRITFGRTERSPELVRFLLHVFFSPPQEGPQLDKDRLIRKRFERIVEIMRDGIASGELAGGDPETLALAFSGMMDLHTMAKSHEPHRRLTSELGEELVDLFMDGAGARNGRG